MSLFSRAAARVVLHMRRHPGSSRRLAALGGFDREGLHRQLAAAGQIALHMRRHPDGSRRLDDVGVLERGRGGVCVVPATETAVGDLPRSRGVESW